MGIPGPMSGEKVVGIPGSMSGGGVLRLWAVIFSNARNLNFTDSDY